MTATAASLLVLDARIENDVQHVDDEIGNHHHDGDEHHQILHDWIVAPANGLDQEPRHTGNVEYRLGDDQAADQEGRLDANDGDYRQHGIAQGVVIIDGGIG